MVVLWKSMPIYGGYLVGISPILWLATWRYWQHLAPAWDASPNVFSVLYAIIATLLTVACVAIPGFGLVTFDEIHGRLPLPIPKRTNKRQVLEKRLRECREVKAEVDAALSRIHKPESAFGVTLQARLTELEGAEETLMAEMSAEALTALNNRATRIVKKELKE